MSERPNTETLAKGSPEARGNRADPRSRPRDPAGTQPKFDPETLTPTVALPLLPSGAVPGNSDPRALPQPISENGAQLPDPLTAPTSTVLESTKAQVSHESRFQFLFGMLGALAVAGVALGAWFALRPPAGPSVPWSSWKPSSNGGDPALQIAEHVEPEYTLSPGHRLVAVTGGPQAIGGQPVVVALRTSGSSPAPLPDNGVFYQLCGEGPNCSIPGKPSLERGLLVRREAFELAMYTFHYIGGASQVIVSYPPLPPTTTSSSAKSNTGSGTSREGSSTTSQTVASTSTSASISGAGSGIPGVPSRVLLFRPDNIQEQLSKPLDQTLSDVVPSVKTITTAPEAGLVDRLTVSLVYDSVLIPEQQSSSVLLLEKASIGG